MQWAWNSWLQGSTCVEINGQNKNKSTSRHTKPKTGASLSHLDDIAFRICIQANRAHRIFRCGRTMRTAFRLLELYDGVKHHFCYLNQFSYLREGRIIGAEKRTGFGQRHHFRLWKLEDMTMEPGSWFSRNTLVNFWTCWFLPLLSTSFVECLGNPNVFKGSKFVARVLEVLCHQLILCQQKLRVRGEMYRGDSTSRRVAELQYKGGYFVPPFFRHAHTFSPFLPKCTNNHAHLEGEEWENKE